MAISILIVSITIAITLWLFFYVMLENKNSKKKHKALLNYYDTQIEMHRFQINKRQNALHTYSFIHYNLEESLFEESIV